MKRRPVAILLIVAALLSTCLMAVSMAGEKEWSDLSDEACTLYRSSRYEEAVEVARRALKEGEKTFGPNDLKIVGSVDDLATYLFAAGNTAEARKLYRRALKILQRNLPKDDPYLTIFMDYLAGVYEKMGDPYQAAKLRESARSARQERMNKARAEEENAKVK